MNNNRIFLWN